MLLVVQSVQKGAKRVAGTKVSRLQKEWTALEQESNLLLSFPSSLPSSWWRADGILVLKYKCVLHLADADSIKRNQI